MLNADTEKWLPPRSHSHDHRWDDHLSAQGPEPEHLHQRVEELEKALRERSEENLAQSRKLAKRDLAESSLREEVEEMQGNSNQ